jgi:hypothetical protein
MAFATESVQDFPYEPVEETETPTPQHPNLAPIVTEIPAVFALAVLWVLVEV